MRATRRSGSCVERNDSFRSTSLEKLKKIDDADGGDVESSERERHADREGRLLSGDDPAGCQDEHCDSPSQQHSLHGDVLAQELEPSQDDESDVEKAEDQSSACGCHILYLSEV